MISDRGKPEAVLSVATSPVAVMVFGEEMSRKERKEEGRLGEWTAAALVSGSVASCEVIDGGGDRGKKGGGDEVSGEGGDVLY